MPHCEHCGKHHEWSECFNTFFYIWERDLLYIAHQDIGPGSPYDGWRWKAHELGFTDAKIDAPWTHKDEGRRIAYDVIRKK
jgi:hypothetical protein